MTQADLREATTADIEALIQAQADSFGVDAWTARMVREEFERPGGVQWVVTRQAAVQGFAFGWLVVGELHVLHIGTVPMARRGGVGRRLLRALLDTPGTESAWLEVRADNAAAIALYLREGFIEVGRRKRYYADGGDAVVMRLSFGGLAPPKPPARRDAVEYDSLGRSPSGVPSGAGPRLVRVPREE